jgi:hypothetical protein
MKKQLIVLFLGVVCIVFSANSQSVGISSTVVTPDASSMLDIQATNKGLLIPRVALTATNNAAPIAAPATSLMVYNTATAGVAPNNVTPGYYYWNGTMWVRFLGARDAWLTTGNIGTNVATNWLGTNDAVDFATRTNNAERMRILSAGNILMNRTTALNATDMLEVQGTATFPDAINGYTNQAGGTGVTGIVSVAAGAGAGVGVYGLSAQSNGAGVYGDGSNNTTGVYGYTTGAAYEGVAGINNAATGAGNGPGVYGQSAQTAAAGVWGSGTTFTRGVLGTTNNATYAAVQGQNDNLDGDGVYGINNAAAGAGGGAGVYGYSIQTSSAGVWGSGGTATRGVLGTTNIGNRAGVHGQNAHIDGDGVYAINSAAENTGLGTGIYAYSDQSGGAGAWGATANAAGIGMIAQNGAAAGTSVGDGIDAFTSQTRGMGVFATNGHTSGTAILAAGNNLTGYYLPGGSGGAFTGLIDGVYALAYDSLTDQTSYTQNAAGVYGKATFNRNSAGDFYHFGVYGQYFDNHNLRNGRRSGGVLGFAQNSGSGNMWGALGYLASDNNLYGAYYSTTLGNGAGKSASGPSTSIGFGAEGGFMGGHVYGSEYGLVTAGNRAGLLVEGETYSTGYYAVLNQTEEGDYVPSYATVSTKPTIYASGTGTMNGGTATIVFDKAFSEVASSEAPVIITVTPMGPSQGLYVESVSNTEFVVKENGSNEVKSAKGSLNFSWIAMATVKNQENPVVPNELQTNEFHSNMNGFMQNERSTTDQQYYMWWDGSNMRYTEPDVEISFTPAESKGSAAKEKRVFETKEMNQLKEKSNTAVQEKEMKIQQVVKNKVNNE